MPIIDKFQARWEEMKCTRDENRVLRKACDALVTGLAEIAGESKEMAIREKAKGVIEMVVSALQGGKM